MPPAREAEALSVPEEKPTSVSSVKKDVWRSAETDTPEIASGSLSFTELPAATADRSAFGLPVDPNEGPDPLPPAIERGEAFQSAPSRPAVAEASVPPSGGFDLSHDASVEPTQSSSYTTNATSPPATITGSSSGSEDFIAAPSASTESSPAPVASPALPPSPEPTPSFAMPSTPESEETGFASEPPSLEGPSEPTSEPDPSAFAPTLQPSEPTESAAPLPSLESPAGTQADPEPITAPQPSEPTEPNPPIPASDPAPETSAPASEEDALPPIQAPGDDLDLIEQPGHPTGSFESPLESSRSGAIPEMTAKAPDSRRPTWSDLTSQSAQKRAQVYPPSRRLSKPKPDKPAGLGLLASLRNGPDRPAAPTSPQVVRASCSFDKGENRLVDFTLSDLNGRPVRFQELDADYVLIDFWGTWCGPCLRSIPHLVQLQNRYDPKRLRVIGVAYERSEPHENARLVQGVMQQLGMNYPVLMGGETDQEPCPLQTAFHVQAYPTMVLVDRHGRILWRESGSNPTTMTRLDRVIASNTRAGAGVLRR